MTGGEPLLREDFPELYRFARRLGLQVLLFTNARLITSAIADLLAAIPPRGGIEVSVYGMTRASSAAVTGRARAFAEAQRGIRRLLDRKIPFVVKGALLPPTRSEEADFAAWATTVLAMEEPPLSALLFALRARRDSEAKNRGIRGLRLTPGEVLAVLTREPARYRREAADLLGRFSAPREDRLFTCGLGPGCVDAYGNFQPCLALRHPGLAYPLRTGSLHAAMARIPRLQAMRATNPHYLARCARCFLRGFCEQCPARSWTENGTLDAPVEYLCEVAHAQARYLGLLGEDERAWEVPDGKNRIQNLRRSEGLT
jgi:radical SAM protein with 4Fe4S-binding SPASM domain